MHTLAIPLLLARRKARHVSSHFMPITAPKRRLVMPQLSHLYHDLLMLVKHLLGDDTEGEETASFLLNSASRSENPASNKGGKLYMREYMAA